MDKPMNAVQAVLVTSAIGLCLMALVVHTLGWRPMIAIWSVCFIICGLLIMSDKQPPT